jgi:hypothetical protein
MTMLPLICIAWVVAVAPQAATAPTFPPPATPQAELASAVSDVATYIFQGKSAAPQPWPHSAAQTADALVLLASNPKLGSEERAEGATPAAWYKLLLRSQVKDEVLTHRVTAALVPVLTDLPDRARSRLARCVFENLGQPMLDLMAEVEAGDITLRASDVCAPIHKASMKRRLSPEQRQELFGRLHAWGKQNQYRHLDVLQSLDMNRLVELILVEDMLATGHPARRQALKQAVQHLVPVEAAYVGRQLDALKPEAWLRDETRKLLILLARADADAALTWARKLEARADDPATNAQVESELHLVALELRLEAADANIAMYGPPIRAGDRAQALAARIDKAYSLALDARSVDIGRYYFERTRTQINDDLEALEAIGATEAALVLQRIVATVGEAGFADEPMQRVEAVRALGLAKVNQHTSDLYAALQNMPRLLMQHQLDHVEAARDYMAVTRRNDRRTERTAPPSVRWYNFARPK